MPTKTILILGGSYVGISSAHYTLKHIIPSLPSPEEYQVVLVSPSAEIIVRPATPRALLSGDLLDQKKLFQDLKGHFDQYAKENFKFIQGLAKNLDHANRVVTVELVTAESGSSAECEIEYHALIIGTGSSTPSPLLSLNSSSSTELKKNWSSFRDALSSAKSIVIAGGGAVGIETAGELGEHLNGRAGFFSSKLVNPKVKITVVSSASEILPVLRPGIARGAEGLLAKVGVEVVKGVKVEEVTPLDETEARDELTGAVKVALSNGETFEADLFIPAYGTTPNTSFVSEELKGEDGRVKTDPQSLRVKDAGERVYAAGDASDYARPAVHILTEAIPVLCTNLKRDLLKEAGETVSGEDRVFKADESETHLVPIGKSKGVGAVKGWKVPSLFVWLIKGRDYWLGMTDWSGKQWAKEA
ncbi:uncharacterized protein BDV14DRAFT_171215 [Aspergillus stella-maris]|uniref:uncharacterized protein n=1 Tax=Aspergillus stella-maris TaxID=1810926 RepID=UPI003CCC9E8A